MNYHLKHYILALISCLFALSACGGGGEQYPSTNWRYIIPNDYHGYLAIRYECENGVPLPENDPQITVQFADDGTFCTSTKSFGSEGDLPIVQMRDGTNVPFIIYSRTYTGYGACCLSSRTIAGGTERNPGEELRLALLWVGNMRPLGPDEPDVPDDSDDFFESRFGLIRVEIPQ